ncbi:MAG TPA: nucleoside-diphosphate sugar epimerase/dehydratase [Dehalococcoidia bacterium]|nr:nucleoside-diphosphate sugar epimerase/dehydratase [Dehalococcoidia bacterium]
MQRWFRHTEGRAETLLMGPGRDALIVVAAYVAALLLRFDFHVPNDSWRFFAASAALIVLVYVVANHFLGIYRTIWAYASSRDAMRLAESTGIATIALFALNVTLPERHVPLSVVVVGGAFVFLGMSGTRIWSKLWEPSLLRRNPAATRVLIAGAGNTGQLVAREFLHNRSWNYTPVCFVDDNPRRQGQRIHGVPVLGTRGDIPTLVRKHNIDVVAIAMPSADGAVMRELISMCQLLRVPVRMVPGLPEIVSGTASPGDLREITIEDLLSREPIEIDYQTCAQKLQGKIVLITGAAGSIGSELARQVARFEPAALHLLDNNESELFDLSMELLAEQRDTEIRSWIADVASAPKIRTIFAKARPQVVFHAAAYKHVPLMEEHPDEAFRVNVLGTLNVCQAAHEQGADRLLFVSTDKAVNAAGVMGASKRIGECIVQAMAERSDTVFCAVRFGNVIGSRGSVVPLFWKQIERGGPVAVTHPEMTRYFLTVSEAVTLLIQTAAFAGQGQILMLDMGDEIRIVELAERMIRMRGLDPGRDIQIVFTGLRPGERIREELVAEGERVQPTSHPKVLLTLPPGKVPWERLHAGILALAEELSSPPEDFANRLHALARIDRKDAEVHLPPA